MKKILLIVVLILAIGGASLYYFGVFDKKADRGGSGSEPIGIANPAAVYCQEQGGASEVFLFESGEDAYCVFEDGSVCWEWDFYRKHCDKGQLKIAILQEGQGDPAEKGERVLVRYKGRLLDGSEFASSPQEKPFSFVLGEGSVPPGWDQGILGMRVGEKRELAVGHALAEGEYGFEWAVPSDETLVFEVELLGIEVE